MERKVIKLRISCAGYTVPVLLYLTDDEAGRLFLKFILSSYIESGWVIDGYGFEDEDVELAVGNAWDGDTLYLLCPGEAEVRVKRRLEKIRIP